MSENLIITMGLGDDEDLDDPVTLLIVQGYGGVRNLYLHKVLRLDSEFGTSLEMESKWPIV